MKNIVRKLTVASIAACFAALGLAGCAQQPAEEELAIEEQQPAYDLVIGTESDEVVDLPIKNQTEQAIVGLQFKLTDAAEYSANVMAADQVWEAGQTADVFFEGVAVEEETVDPEANEAEEAAAEEASETGEPLLLNEVYDVQLTAADGTVFALHQLSLTGLANAEDIAVSYDAATGFGYLTYLEDGAEVSTLESEQHIADAAAAVAQAEAEAAAAAQAEAEAQAQAEAEAAAAQQSRSSSYSSGSGSGGYDSVSSGSGSGSAPAQREDTCIDPDDLALN